MRSKISQVRGYYEDNDPRGEYILIIEGSNEIRPDNQDSYESLDERAYVIKLMEEGLSKKDAIKRVAKDRKLKKDLVYKEVLDI